LTRPIVVVWSIKGQAESHCAHTDSDDFSVAKPYEPEINNDILAAVQDPFI